MVETQPRGAGGCALEPFNLAFAGKVTLGAIGGESFNHDFFKLLMSTTTPRTRVLFLLPIRLCPVTASCPLMSAQAPYSRVECIYSYALILC